MPAVIESQPAESVAYRLQALDTIAAGVAHEFNNVMQIVRGYVSFARNGLPEDNAARDDLAQALIAVDRASDLAKRMLHLARGAEENNLADANDAVSSIGLLVRPIIGENIEVAVVPAVEPLFARVSDNGLRTALLNLCVNARDAMPEGGQLRITTESCDPAQAPHESARRLGLDECVQIVVADDGDGMSEETRQRVFDPLFTTKAEGVGLGLALVKAFVDRSGGVIEVDSTRGRGTTFTLYLPLCPADEAIAAASAGDQAPQEATPV